MAKMNTTTKSKIAESARGIKKVSDDQAKAIVKLYKSNDPKFEEVAKLVHRSVLYKLTGDERFAPKTSKSQRAEQLNSILFS